MHLIDKHAPRAAPAIISLVLLVCSVGLAACGGSSKPAKTASSSTSASQSSSPSTTTGAGRSGGFAGRSGGFATIRACLQKNGITLPQRPRGATGAPPGAGASGGEVRHRGGFPLGGGALPKGVTAAHFREALQKCNGGRFGAGGFAGRFGRRGAQTQSPAFKQSLSKFVACARENGVSLPTPNSSGSGPVFDTKGINTRSTKFRAAVAKCRSLLANVIGGGGPRGAPGGGPATGAGAPAGTP